MEIDLQRYLETMERRADERHITLVEKLEEINHVVADHGTRIVVLENTDKRHRWYAATLVTAMIGFVVDFIITKLGGKH